MEGPKLILSDLFGDRRPPPGPLAENLSLVTSFQEKMY